MDYHIIKISRNKKQYPDVARKLKNMIGGQRVENARFHF